MCLVEPDWHDERVEVPPDDLVAGVSEHAFGGLVPVPNCVVGADADDCVFGSRADDRQVLVQTLLLDQGLVQVDLHAHAHAHLIHVEGFLDVVHCAGGNPPLDVTFVHPGADQRDRDMGGARVVLDPTAQ